MRLLFACCYIGVATLAACASPRETLYTLESPITAEQGAQAEGRPTVLVGPISIPPMVDRPQLVIRQGSDQVTTPEQQRWAAPLKETLPRVLATELAVKKPATRFAAYPSAALNKLEGRIIVDISRLDIVAGEGAVLEAHWIYKNAEGVKAAEGDVQLRERAAGANYGAYVAAMRAACVRLADAIAERV